MPNQTQSTVTFYMESMDPRTQQVTYWFSAHIIGYECTDIRFGLSRSGEWTAAKSSFFELDTDTKDEVLKLGRQLLLKILS